MILVRHAMPEVVPGRPSSSWTLGEGAKVVCAALAAALPWSLAPVTYSSGQPKADETAAVIAAARGLAIARDPRLAEVRQPGEGGWIESYRALAAGYLEGRAVLGWEPPSAVRNRFVAAIAAALSAHPVGDVVVVTHGLALSLWLAEAAGVHAAPFWRALTFPDAWRFEPGTARLERLFDGGVLPPEDG